MKLRRRRLMVSNRLRVTAAGEMSVYSEVWQSLSGRAVVTKCFGFGVPAL
jgi:hypothetical protein